MTEVVTQLTIDARGAEVGSATYLRALAAAQAGLDRFLDKEEAINRAQTENATVMLTASTSVGKLARDWDRLMASVDPAFAATKKIESAYLLADRAATILGKSTAEVERVMGAVRLQHDAVAAAAKRQSDEYLRLAAAGREAHAADQAQNRYATRLGIRDTPTTSARTSASTFEAELGRMEQIAGMKARQIGETFARDLDARLVAGAGRSARDAGSIFAAEFERLDNIARLRAQQRGANFAADLNARMGVGRDGRSARDSASAFEELLAERERGQGGRPRLSGQQVQGLGFQANDVATMALLGASPSQIAFSQGGQILQTLQMGEGGVSGSLRAIKGGATAAVTSLAEMVGTTGLIATGLGAAALAGAGFYALINRGKSLNDVLEGHKTLIEEIAQSYPHAAEAAKAYEDEARRLPQSVVQADVRDQAIDEGAVYESSMRAIRDRVRIASRQSFTFGQAGTEFLSGLSAELDVNQLGAAELSKKLGDIRLDDSVPSRAREFAKRLQEAAKEAANLEAKVKGTKAAAQSLEDRATLRGDPASRDNLNRFLIANSPALVSLQRRQDAELAGINAQTPQERADAARAAVHAEPFDPMESGKNRQFREDAAAALALAQALKQVEDADRAYTLSLRDRFASSQADIAMQGASVRQIEEERFKRERLAEIEREALTNGTAWADRQRAAVDGLAKAWGAVSEAAAQARTVNDLNFERSQLGRSQLDQRVFSQMQSAGLLENGEIVGETNQRIAKGMRENAQMETYAGILRSGQDRIRQLGQEADAIGLTGRALESFSFRQQALNEAIQQGIKLGPDQVAVIDKMADAYGRVAEYAGKASFLKDFRFDVAQMDRGAQDQRVFGQLRGTPYEGDKRMAGYLRDIDDTQQNRENGKGFFSDIVHGAEEVARGGGRSFGEVFRDAALDAVSKVGERYLDQALDSLMESIFPTPSEPGGLLPAKPDASTVLDPLFGRPTGTMLNPIYVKLADVALPGSLDPVTALGKAFVSADRERDTSLDNRGGVTIGIAQLGSRIFKDGKEISQIGRFSGGALADRLPVNDNFARAAGIGAGGGAGNAFLDYIATREGTAGRAGGGYNTSLGYGAFTGGERNLVGMTLNQIDALQTQMLRNPANSFNSSALGRYQIVRTTRRGLQDEMGLSGNELFDADLQDRMGLRLAQRRGASAAGLGNEWASLKGRPADEILSKYNEGMSTATTSLDKMATGATSAANAAADASTGLGQLGNGLGKMGSALGQAPAGGSAGGGGGFLSALSSLFTGGFSAGSPMGGAGGAQWYRSGSGGRFFATGGAIYGPGSATSDSVPIWASNGEYMINAAATMRHRPLLEHINRGGDLPRFAQGGPIGLPMPRLQAPANGNLSVQVINPPGMPAMVEESRTDVMDAEGNRQLKIQMRAAARDEMTTPGRKGQKAMSGLYGAQRKVREN